MPSSPPSRRAPLLAAILGVVGAALAVAWWVQRPAEPEGGASPAATAGLPPADLARVARAAEGLVDVPDPFARPTEPLATDALRAALAHRFEWKRVEALRLLVQVGAASSEIAADLEGLRATGSPVEKAWATAALMKVRGTRAHVRDLAEQAAAFPRPTPAQEALLAFDPSAGGALVVAMREASERAARPGAPPTPGLDAAIERLVAGPEGGAAAVAEAARIASGADLPLWLRVAQAFQPVPREALAAAATRLAATEPADRLAALAFLAQPDTDLAQAGDDVADALLRVLESPRKPKQPLDAGALRAISRLPRLPPATVDRLMTLARSGSDDLRSVLGALTRAGPAAAAAAPSLLAMAPGAEESLRPLLADALAATRAPEVEAYALERLRVARPDEREAWIRRLGAVADPAAFAPLVGEGLSDAQGPVAALAAEALARVDPDLRAPQTADLLARALADARPPVRAAAILSVGRLSRVPTSLVDALAPALDGPPGPERASATNVVLESARLGPAAAPFVPYLLRLATQTDAAADPSVPAQALRALAAVDPKDEGARAAFRAVLLAPGGEDARRAALWGLSRLASPAPEDRAAVRAAKDDPRLAATAAEVLARPAWR